MKSCYREFVPPASRSKTFSLHDSIPPYLKGNRGIVTGYRAYYDYHECLWSMFKIHNETLNIWSHFIGGVLFACFIGFLFFEFEIVDTPKTLEWILTRCGGKYVIDFLQGVLSSLGKGVSSPGLSSLFRALKKYGNWKDYFIILVFLFSSISCLICSALFHLLNAHKEWEVYDKFALLDYIGINNLIVGSFLIVLYYGLYCKAHEFYLKLYLTMVSMLGLLNFLVVYQLSRMESRGLIQLRLEMDEYAYKTSLKKPEIEKYCKWSNTIRCLCYWILSLVLLTGFIHMTHLNGGFWNFWNMVPDTIFYLLLEGVCYGLGTIIYIFHIPEAILPGKVDIIGHSHQLWHIFVFMAAFCHYKASIAIAVYRLVEKRC